MGFVKSPEEITRIEHALSHPRFVGGEMLSVEFLTDESVVARVLPPPLEPADTPAVRGDGRPLAVQLRRRLLRRRDLRRGPPRGHRRRLRAGDVHGQRRADDLRPRPVRRAEEDRRRATCIRRGDNFRGWVERGGVRHHRAAGRAHDRDTGPSDAEGYNFNFKARPAADGIGLEEDAILTRARFEVHATAALRGRRQRRPARHRPRPARRDSGPLGRSARASWSAT